MVASFFKANKLGVELVQQLKKQFMDKKHCETLIFFAIMVTFVADYRRDRKNLE